MMFQNYISEVKSQLTCNCSDFFVRNHITFDYSEKIVNKNLDYFLKCHENNLPTNKALLFFNDYLRKNINQYELILEKLLKLGYDFETDTENAKIEEMQTVEWLPILKNFKANFDKLIIKYVKLKNV